MQSLFYWHLLFVSHLPRRCFSVREQRGGREAEETSPPGILSVGALQSQNGATKSDTPTQPGTNGHGLLPRSSQQTLRQILQ